MSEKGVIRCLQILLASVVVFYASVIWIEYDKGKKMKELHQKHNEALVEMYFNSR